MNKLLYKLPDKTVTRIERILLIAETDYHIRYYGSRLGVLWAFINPFFQIIVYYFAFSFFMGMDKTSNFILYIFTGIITWQFFSETTEASIQLFLTKRFILENVYIKKVDFFISLIISKLKGFVVNFIIFIIFSFLFFDPHFSINVLYILPVLFGFIFFTAGISFFLATMFIFFRDLYHLWGVVLMAGFWTIPTIWDYHIVFDKYPLMMINPLTVYLINVREIFIYDTAPNLRYLLTAIVISIFVAVSGYLFMRFRSKKALEFL